MLVETDDVLKASYCYFEVNLGTLCILKYINQRGTILNKTNQIRAYADAVVILSLIHI